MTAQELWLLGAIELIKAYKNRSLSPVDVVTSHLERISKLNPQINAFHLLMEETALLSAKKK